MGNKVSVVHTQNTAVIVGALDFRNEYDDHTLEKTLEQTRRLNGCVPKSATVDLGYKGKSTIGETVVQIPKPFGTRTTSLYKQQKLKQSFRRRVAIEPIISHLKADRRLCRNFYKGFTGDTSASCSQQPPSTSNP